MALVQQSLRRILATIVYAGPGLSGKTTNLTVLGEWLPNTRMTLFPTTSERTAFFDELPVEVPLADGWRIVFKVQTVPGQAAFREARELVLRRPDGVVFVADSDPRRIEANELALDEVTRILERGDRGLSEIPVVFQYNKQDMAGALGPETLNARLNPGGAAWVLAEAHRGVGIVETLALAVEKVSAVVAETYGVQLVG
jgi:signal recognition particle receptor subunit beta